MRNLLSIITVFTLLTSININATSVKVISESELLFKQSCFSWYHDFFHEHYGGINLENVGDFNDLVHQCQDTFEQ